MKREFSAGSLAIFQREYPAIDKETANDILTKSSIVRIRTQQPEPEVRDSLSKEFYFIVPVVYQMIVPDPIISAFDSEGIELDKVIDIYPGDDGIIYMQYEAGSYNE